MMGGNGSSRNLGPRVPATEDATGPRRRIKGGQGGLKTARDGQLLAEESGDLGQTVRAVADDRAAREAPVTWATGARDRGRAGAPATVDSADRGDPSVVRGRR